MAPIPYDTTLRCCHFMCPDKAKWECMKPNCPRRCCNKHQSNDIGICCVLNHLAEDEDANHIDVMDGRNIFRGLGFSDDNSDDHESVDGDDNYQRNTI